MSQIRAILFRMRATVVLVAVAALFGGALFSSPAARASSTAHGLSSPCDHQPSVSGKDGAPIKPSGSAAHCPDCCLFGGMGALALPDRVSFVTQPPAEKTSLAFYAAVGTGARELLFFGAANGARAPPVSI